MSSNSTIHSQIPCNFRAGVQYERNSGLNFFSPFLGLSHPILAKNNAGKRFFEIFCYFFWNFLAGIEYERNSGLKFFPPLLTQSHPISSLLAKNNAGKKFFNLLNFFDNFFRNFLSGFEYERNSGLIFFSPFLGLSDPVLAKNNAGKRFF